ncbi:MAG TPA: secretin N-terminal domain-containing protein [Candidatus Dormibacteraeota bacterium]|nr:secretin N-terminal domain-containing protein [Candidatus Dormibacteraeota bacterium]
MRIKGSFFLALIVAFLALAIPTRAQEKEASQKTAPEAQTRKVIPLKYVAPSRAAHLLGGFGAMLLADDALKVLTVAGSTSVVESVEEAIKKLDVPPPPARSIEITAYFLLGTRQSVEGASLPKELDEVVNQLKRVLSYQGFRLLDNALIRAMDGERASVSGVATSQGERADFQFGFNHAQIVPEEKVTTIRIHDLNFVMERPERSVETKEIVTRQPKTSAQIRTDIDLPEGLKVVVGKTSFYTPDNALVLVLTAKVVN